MPGTRGEKLDAHVYKLMEEEAQIEKKKQYEEDEDHKHQARVERIEDLKKEQLVEKKMKFMREREKLEREQEEETKKKTIKSKKTNMSNFHTGAMTVGGGGNKEKETTYEVKYQHTGLWQPYRIAFEKEKMVWSCCMSKYQDSQGCQPMKVDKKRWILSSY